MWAPRETCTNRGINKEAQRPCVYKGSGQALLDCICMELVVIRTELVLSRKSVRRPLVNDLEGSEVEKNVVEHKIA